MLLARTPNHKCRARIGKTLNTSSVNLYCPVDKTLNQPAPLNTQNIDQSFFNRISHAPFKVLHPNDKVAHPGISEMGVTITQRWGGGGHYQQIARSLSGGEDSGGGGFMAPCATAKKSLAGAFPASYTATNSVSIFWHFRFATLYAKSLTPHHFITHIKISSYYGFN